MSTVWFCSDNAGEIFFLSVHYLGFGLYLSYGAISIFSQQVRTKMRMIRLDFKTQLSDPYKTLNSTVIY